MKRIAKFEKVSFEQFKSDMAQQNYTEQQLADFYRLIELPKRATRGSAGYDFKTPYSLKLNPKESVRIATGIRCRIEEGYVLQLYPRSSMGFKYRMQLDNTVGIIDSDYYHADNEGHIMIKISNDTNENKTIELKRGMAFCQGIFLEYGITIDDDCTQHRSGGFGSTDQKNETRII